MNRHERGSWNSDDSGRPRWGLETQLVAEYEYRRADGSYAFTIRKGQNPDGEKCFNVRRKNLKPFGDRIEPEDKVDYFTGMGDEPAVLYRLPELIAGAQTPDKLVVTAEGEKDVETAVYLGYVATCNPFGALKWRDEYSPYLTGCDVIIFQDNDERGRQHASHVAAKVNGHARRTRILALPGCKDITEWKEAREKAGLSKEQIKAELDALIDSTAAVAFSSEPGADGKPGTEVQASKVEAADELAPAFSEEALALKFAARHAHNLRYVAMWNKWLRWDGTRWAFDDTKKAFSLSRDLCREVSIGVNKGREAKAIASAKTRAAVISLAGEDRRLAATVDQWDADPWLLNTPGGVIDLRTGKRRDHRPDDYMTKLAAVAPDASCPTPLWSKFLSTVTAGDADLQKFLARMCGYALTGSIDEHALFFLYGLGSNGKGVFVNTVSGVMGDYHHVAPIETFTESSTDRHPTELAMLRGARMVTAAETEEGRRWAESKIKVLTGGDPISARFMRQDFFEFTPQFKLIIAGNHKPGLRSVDEAIRRRFNMIPFSVTVPKAERDISLSEKLKSEWPGILAWMIEGCISWQNNRLAPPSAVIEATKNYLEAEDALLTFIEEVCVKDPQLSTVVGTLFMKWKEWAESRGEHVGSSKRLAQRLEDQRFEKVRTRRGSEIQGLGLNIPKREPPEDGEPKWKGPSM